MNIYGYIYLVQDMITNMIYIGQRKGLFNSKYLGSGKIIKRYIKKYNKNRFTVRQIDCGYSKIQLDELEIFWIKKLDCIWPNGFNLAPGGDSGSGMKTLETREKIRISMTGKKQSKEHKEHNRLSHIGKTQLAGAKEKLRLFWLGKKQSKETIEKRRLANIGKKRSEKTKEKIKLAMTGKKLSVETIEKIRVSKLGKKQSKETIEKRRLSMLGKNTDKHSPEIIEKARMARWGTKITKLHSPTK